MDINDSQLARYKSVGSTKVSSKSASTSSTGAARQQVTRAGAANVVSDSKSPMPKEGQVIKGEIIDLHFKEVKIRIEPGGQLLSAKLSGDIPLSIGQSAQFMITEDSAERLTLKYMPQDQPLQDATILKALTASGLPMTERNKAIVLELLNHKMPIDKQTLQLMAKSSGMNRDAAPLTLVLMHKNHIPMSASNLRQFESYQNGSHQILNDINKVSNNIIELLRETVTKLDSQNQTLSIDASGISQQTEGRTPLSEDVIPTSAKMPYDAAQVANNQALLSRADVKLTQNIAHFLDFKSGISSPQAELTTFLNPEELSLLSKAIEQKLMGTTEFPESIQSSLVNQFSEGTIPLSEAVKLMEQLFGKSPGDNQSLPLTTALQYQVDPLVSEIVKNLADKFSSLEEKQSDFKGLLNYILGKSTPGQEAAIPQLTQLPEYNKLMEEALHHKWTLTPEQLSKKEALPTLYKNLQDDLEQLSELIKFSKDSAESMRLSEPVKNLQDNLQFMKNLNEIFNYVQLPIQFKNKDVHGDFYVFNKKNALRDKKDNLSVLLHLDMAELGPINIHMNMDLNKIQATFYIGDSTAGRIIAEHLPELSSSLMDKGYHLQARVDRSEPKNDFVEDILEQEPSDGSVQRYTFDIRA
ncbi:MAG TPA: flagellar hook-length control protein FliK [Mobilitalea sp.]|nr:flagellar hook-length control protein FliK [Mobilitalea sp.]